MKVSAVILDLLHAERQADMAKLIGAFLQIFIANAPKLITISC
jgi:hypothetical protein